MQRMPTEATRLPFFFLYNTHIIAIISPKRETLGLEVLQVTYLPDKAPEPTEKPGHVCNSGTGGMEIIDAGTS